MKPVKTGIFVPGNDDFWSKLAGNDTKVLSLKLIMLIIIIKYFYLDIHQSEQDILFTILYISNKGGLFRVTTRCQILFELLMYKSVMCNFFLLKVWPCNVFLQGNWRKRCS